MTAELAVAMTGVALLLGVLLTAVTLAQSQLRAVDAAAAGARAAARGEVEANVLGLTHRLAGEGASATVTTAGDLVTVHVRIPVDLALPGSPVLSVSGRASAAAEPHLPLTGSAGSAGQR